jgi:hypothetical protein
MDDDITGVTPGSTIRVGEIVVKELEGSESFINSIARPMV